MKLYGSLASPFVARCWLTVTAKGGGADLEMYDGGRCQTNWIGSEEPANQASQAAS